MNDKNNLPAKPSNSGNAGLQNSGSGTQNLLDIAVSRMTPEEIAALRTKALEEKLRLDVEAAQRSLDYQYGRKVAEDHVETFNMLEKGGKLTSQKVVSDIKTGAGNMRLESKSGTTCFVATAAYGDPDHGDVVFLRQYRDSTLKKTALGRAFISIYWKIGPQLAEPVMKYKTLQLTLRYLIGNLVSFLRQVDYKS